MESRITQLKFSTIPLYFSERKILLSVVDLFIINVALLVSLGVRAVEGFTRLGALANSVWDRLGWFIILSALWLTISSLVDIYDLAVAANTWVSVGRTAACALSTVFIYSFIPFVTPALPVTRIEALFLPGVAVLGLVFWRVIYGTIFVHPNFQQRVLIIGSDWAGLNLAHDISELALNRRESDCRGVYKILGIVDAHETQRNIDVQSIPVLGNRHDLIRLVHELNPDELIIAIANQQEMNSELFQAIMDCREMGIHFSDMATYYERLTGRVPLEYVGRNLNVVLPMVELSEFHIFSFCKRLIDISSSIIGCAIVLLIAPFVWLVNSVSAPGSLFYSQERIGKGGRPFSLLKFRSMIVDAEEPGCAVWASQNDPRITPVGRILRKTRLDELPQFWNILKGEMSLVGPRPERPEFVGELTEKIPFYRTRHAVLPGLTGWAQIKYPYGASLEDALVKLQYDLYYIKRQSIFFDLQIIFKTIAVVLTFRGR